MNVEVAVPYNGAGLLQVRVVYLVAFLPQVVVQADQGAQALHCPLTS